MAWIGLSSVRSTLPSSGSGFSSARFSASGLAGDGERVAVHEPGVEQRLHEHGDAAVAVDVVHHVLAERLQVADVRNLVADAVEVVDGELDLGLVGDGEQVQDDVGRSAERHRHGDRVLERLLGQDVAGGDAEAQQVDDGLARAVRVVVAAAVGGRGRSPSRAGSCRGPRRRSPWCWRCTCRRRHPRPGRRRTRCAWRRPGSSCRPCTAPTASNESMMVMSFSVPSLSFTQPGAIEPA